jgi:RND family efflux transporter MFP subunit
LALTACGKQAAAPDAARPVLTQLIAAGAGDETLVYSGEVRSRHEIPLSFRVGGKISARLVDNGRLVKAGDVLARLDPGDTALSLAAATAQLDLARAEQQRYRELHAKNFVSRAALDARESSFKSALAQTDLARNQASYTVLRAEHSGVIGLISAEVGQVVSAGQTVMRLARPDTMEVAIAIPESRMPDVRALKAAEISLWADNHARYRGSLRELSPVADPVTRTFAARVTINQPDAKVLLGMTASVRFSSPDGDQRVRVPLTAIFQQDAHPALWVVGGDRRVTLRPVTVAAYRENAAVLAGGARPGERIVVAGVHKLTAGERVQAVEQTNPLAAPSPVPASPTERTTDEKPTAAVP